ncbi:putative DNA ligase-like protein [Phycisphaerae bacterium RAS1]|nr:putative DNA ligase-like protein [Phycisphaerae bacterium RAS1]
MATARRKLAARATSKSALPVELPRRIDPMLAQAADEPFDSPQHLFEIKWDGTRCVAFFDGARVRLQNRRDIEMRDRYPELACLCGLPPGTVLDGEVIVLDQGKPSFHKLAKREQCQDPQRIAAAAKRIPATLIAFDLLFLAGKDITGRPLVERRELLRNVVARLGSPHVIAADYVVGAGRAYFQAAEKHALEGIMAKRLDSPYLPGKRSAHWLKIKVATVGVFDVLGFVPREDDPIVSALVVGERIGRRWVFKAKVGSGFTETSRAEWHRNLAPLPALAHPPADGPKEAVWRETGLKARVRYFEKTPTGKLRAPVFLGIAGDSSK